MKIIRLVKKITKNILYQNKKKKPFNSQKELGSKSRSKKYKGKNANAEGILIDLDDYIYNSNDAINEIYLWVDSKIRRISYEPYDNYYTAKEVDKGLESFEPTPLQKNSLIEILEHWYKFESGLIDTEENEGKIEMVKLNKRKENIKEVLDYACSEFKYIALDKDNMMMILFNLSDTMKDIKKTESGYKSKIKEQNHQNNTKSKSIMDYKGKFANARGVLLNFEDFINGKTTEVAQCFLWVNEYDNTIKRISYESNSIEDSVKISEHRTFSNPEEFFDLPDEIIEYWKTDHGMEPDEEIEEYEDNIELFEFNEFIQTLTKKYKFMGDNEISFMYETSPILFFNKEFSDTKIVL